jgi:hypothetical protein
MGEAVCMQDVTVVGGIGKPLIGKLLQEGFRVTAVARAGSERKLPSGCG